MSGADSERTRAGRRLDRRADDRSTGATRAACAEAVVTLGADGAAVVLTAGPPGPHHLLHATDAVADALAELQQVLGEGPTLDAVTSGLPVDVPDLADGAALTRWPGFAPEARSAGAAAVLSLPLEVAGTVFGVVELHRRTLATRPAGPSDDPRARAIAHDLARTVLHDLASHGALAGTPATADPLLGRPEVDQAAGMTSVHLGVSVADALTRLRAAAFSRGQPLLELARDVLEGRTRLDED